VADDIRLLISRAGRTLTRHFGDRAAELDLSVVQGQALIVLAASPGSGLGALARSLSKDQASTSIMVDKLMSLGLVQRETDKEDRRRALLYLTSQSKEYAEHLLTARDDINRLVLDALGPKRSKELEALLTDLLAAIEGA
jgi:MarR family transcriptional regulator, organic hydroperoxide resistance regulator